MKSVCILAFLVFLAPGFVHSQESRFDTGDEGWRAAGDPESVIPTWFHTGGNPDGWVRTIDASTGGTWQWVAPAKFLGNKCTAYGTYLRFDLTASATAPNPNRPDVTLIGGNTTLVFNTPNDPATTWTHYDVLLRENAGWRVGNVNGAVPTQAQFRTVLSNLTTLQIRGEFLSSGDDRGGLDNVVLEGAFAFDLDSNDSTTPMGSLDFRADSLCAGDSPVADTDALLLAETRIDSVVVEILNATDNPLEFLTIAAWPPALNVAGNNTRRLALLNGGQAGAGDFRDALTQIRYRNTKPNATRAMRLVESRVYTFCGETARGQAFIPYFPAGFAGVDSSLTLCADAGPQDLRAFLGPDISTDGRWEPALPSGGSTFRPATDLPGAYRYLVESPAACPSDSALLIIGVAYPPAPLPDTIICRDSALTLAVQPASAFATYQWSSGQQQAAIQVSEAGLYAVTVSSLYGNCVFRDSARVAVHLGFAGVDNATTRCDYDTPFDLRILLGDPISTDGSWIPALRSGNNIFDPADDSPGAYQYIVGGAYGCPADSALVQIGIVYPPQLPADVILCRDSVITLAVEPAGVFATWKWNTGRNQPEISVSDAGLYTVTVTSPNGICTFWDSVQVTMITCGECPVYVPNVFSPNDDGVNDVFVVSSHCLYLRYRLQLFDRWGNLVFQTEQPDAFWDGRFQGRDLPPGVFVWLLDTDAEFYGASKHSVLSGSVTLVR